MGITYFLSDKIKVPFGVFFLNKIMKNGGKQNDSRCKQIDHH